MKEFQADPVKKPEICAAAILAQQHGEYLGIVGLPLDCMIALNKNITSTDPWAQETRKWLLRQKTVSQGDHAPNEKAPN